MNKFSFPNFEITKNIGYVFLGLAMALMLFIDFGLVMRPQFQALSSVGRKARELSINITKAKYNIKNITTLENVAGQLKEKLKKAEEDLIGHEEPSMVIEDILKIAAKYDVQINQIIPLEEPSAKALKDGTWGFLAVPISVKAEGGYHNIGLFLNAAETDEAFLDIQSFEIAENPQSPKKHTLTMTIMSFIPKKIIE